jgi:hypothetical protein
MPWDWWIIGDAQTTTAQRGGLVGVFPEMRPKTRHSRPGNKSKSPWNQTRSIPDFRRGNINPSLGLDPPQIVFRADYEATAGDRQA